MTALGSRPSGSTCGKGLSQRDATSVASVCQPPPSARNRSTWTVTIRASEKALADGLMLLIEGAFSIHHLFGSQGPSQCLVETADRLIDAHLQADQAAKTRRGRAG